MAYLVERRFDQAIADYSKALEMRPEDASIFVARGYAFLVKGELNKAVADFTSAIRISPSHSLALNNRGLAYRKLGKDDLAIVDYSDAINANPLYALAYNNRGYVFESLGRKPEAIEDFRNALAIDPSLVAARDALVRLSAASNLAELSTKRVAAGKELAGKSCAWCHAIGSSDNSPNKDAPRFRDLHDNHPILTLRQPITRAIATPHDKMPKLPLSDAEVDQIIAYINSLRSTP
jgi:tetratricopeptide (TPR) repeat protein